MCAYTLQFLQIERELVTGKRRTGRRSGTEIPGATEIPGGSRCDPGGDPTRTDPFCDGIRYVKEEVEIINGM